MDKVPQLIGRYMYLRSYDVGLNGINEVADDFSRSRRNNTCLRAKYSLDKMMMSTCYNPTPVASTNNLILGHGLEYISHGCNRDGYASIRHHTHHFPIHYEHRWVWRVGKFCQVEPLFTLTKSVAFGPPFKSSERRDFT